MVGNPPTSFQIAYGCFKSAPILSLTKMAVNGGLTRHFKATPLIVKITQKGLQMASRREKLPHQEITAGTDEKMRFTVNILQC